MAEMTDAEKKLQRIESALGPASAAALERRALIRGTDGSHWQPVYWKLRAQLKRILEDDKERHGRTD